MKLEAVPVKSADRAFDILEFVGAAADAPTFSQLMAALGIPRSSLFHLLNNLLARGYLVQDGASTRYLLGPRIRELADRVACPSLAARVQPLLSRLSATVNETTGFYIRVGDMAETVGSAVSTQALTYTMKVGERAPLYALSGGKILLAQLAPAELEAYLQRIRFDAITPRTLRSADALRREIVTARAEGFAYSRDEFTPGITGIATPVTHQGRVFGALNLAVPSVRFALEREAGFRRELSAIAAALGQLLS